MTLLDYYRRRAPEYESIYEKPERQLDLAALKEHLARMLSGHAVLELACGTGYWTAVLASVAESILATDADPVVLALAKAKGLPGDRIRFELADAYSPDTIPGTFTACFAGFWWSHVPRQQLRSFLDALHRRLGAGALVVFCDNRYVAGSSTAIAHRDDQGDTFQIRTLGDGSRQQVLKNFPTRKELDLLLNGCDGMQLVELTYYWCVAYRVPRTDS